MKGRLRRLRWDAGESLTDSSNYVFEYLNWPMPFLDNIYERLMYS